MWVNSVAKVNLFHFILLLAPSCGDKLEIMNNKYLNKLG